MRSVSLRLAVVLSAALLVLFPVVLLALLAGLLVGAIEVAVRVNGVLGGKLIIIVIPVFWAIVVAARDLWRARRLDPAPGPHLTPQADPGVWAELRIIAQQMGEPVPDRIVVIPEANAAVREVHGQRELLLGLPLLVGLTRGQLTAVLAHELGHLAAGHTRGSRTLLRAEHFIEHLIDNLRSNLVKGFVLAYRTLYRRVSRAVLRSHELDSDQWSARLAGSATAAAALTQVSRVALAWHILESEYLPLMDDAGQPASISEGLVEVLRARAGDLDAFSQHRAAAAGSAFDTHPPLGLRLTAFRALARPEPRGGHPVDAAAPAWELLARPGPRLAQIELGLRVSGAPSVSWIEVAHAALATNMAERSRLIMGELVRLELVRLELVRLEGIHGPTAGQLLAALARGRGEDLARPLIRGDVPAGQIPELVPVVLTQMLTGVVAVLMNAAGLLRVQPDWSADGPFALSLASPAGVTDEAGLTRSGMWPFTEAIQAAAHSPAAVPALAQRLRQAGADLDLVLEASDTAPAAVILGALTLVVPKPQHDGGRQARHDVLVYDDGLLAVRTPREARTNFRQSVAVMFTPAHQQERGTVVRIGQLAQAIGDHPEMWAADPRNQAHWTPFGTIRTATWRSGLDHKRLDLVLHNGSRQRYTLYPSKQSRTIGDVEGIIARSLG